MIPTNCEEQCCKVGKSNAAYQGSQIGDLCPQNRNNFGEKMGIFEISKIFFINNF